MRVPSVTTGDGQQVTLDFAAGGVTVRPVIIGQQRAVRGGAGALILAFGLAAVAGNAEDRGSRVFSVVVWAVFTALLVTAAGAAVWWLLLQRRAARVAPEVITASEIRSGRSAIDGPEITIQLSTAGGADREFRAYGHTGALLAQQFGAMLGVTERR